MDFIWEKGSKTCQPQYTKQAAKINKRDLFGVPNEMSKIPLIKMRGISSRAVFAEE